MIRNIAYVDRSWGHCKDKHIGGDMGFSFNDAPDSRTEDIDELIASCRDYALGDDAVYCGDTYDPDSGTFAIYEIVQTDVMLDEDDPLWFGVDVGEKKLIGIFVCATKDVAGWIEEEKYYKNVKTFYREED